MTGMGAGPQKWAANFTGTARKGKSWPKQTLLGIRRTSTFFLVEGGSCQYPTQAPPSTMRKICWAVRASWQPPAPCATTLILHHLGEKEPTRTRAGRITNSKARNETPRRRTTTLVRE